MSMINDIEDLCGYNQDNVIIIKEFVHFFDKLNFVDKKKCEVTMAD